MVCAATKIAEVCIVLPLVHSRRIFNPQTLINLNKNGHPTVVLGERYSDSVDGPFDHYRLAQTVSKNHSGGAKN